MSVDIDAPAPEEPVAVDLAQFVFIAAKGLERRLAVLALGRWSGSKLQVAVSYGLSETSIGQHQ